MIVKMLGMGGGGKLGAVIENDWEEPTFQKVLREGLSEEVT